MHFHKNKKEMRKNKNGVGMTTFFSFQLIYSEVIHYSNNQHNEKKYMCPSNRILIVLHFVV